MKVIWLCDKIKGTVGEYDKAASARGYVEGLYWHLCKDGISIYPVMPERLSHEDYIADKNYAVYQNKCMTFRKMEKTFLSILEKVKPDIVHIWGTESPRCKAMADVCMQLGMQDRVVVSLQGICSQVAEYYQAELPVEIVNRFTLRDFVKRDNIKAQQKKFYMLAKDEDMILSNMKYVFGRTEWDKAYIKKYYPDTIYFKCGEMLADTFYQSDAWNYSTCRKHSIFFSQAYYPLKGFHQLIKACRSLKDEYNDLSVLVAGNDFFHLNKKISPFRESSYSEYLKQMIQDFHLKEHVTALGRLDAEAMKTQYLRSNVFVSSSVVENSPNSVSEAMILGVPCIASKAGGTASILTDEEGILYDFEDTDALYNAIRRVFENPEQSAERGNRARIAAQRIHDREKIKQDTLSAYQIILKKAESKGERHV